MKWKYTHLMLFGAAGFEASIVNMINNARLGFNPEEHRFIYMHKRAYECVSGFDNTMLDEEFFTKTNKLKEYLHNTEYLFMHCNLLSAKHYLFLTGSELKKMIWVVWGHDLYRKPACGVIPKARRFAGNLWRWDYLKNHKIRQFKAIGVGFKFDAIEVKRRFGSNIKILTTPYGLMPDMHNFKSVIDGIAKENASAKHGNKPYKVMIGHSAFPYLNHEKTVNQLKKFKDENILISFPFPYGSPEYAGKIANFAIEIFGTKKVEIINERLPIEDYIKYLTSVDACVLEQYQGGLGNFYILLYLEKKLFMNDAGILKMAADLEGIESYSTDNIDRMSFTEFSSPLSNGKRGKEFSELYIDGENFIRMWKNTLKTLR